MAKGSGSSGVTGTEEDGELALPHLLVGSPRRELWDCQVKQDLLGCDVLCNACVLQSSVTGGRERILAI